MSSNTAAIVIASSDKNIVEERVCVHSLLNCGHQLSEIFIMDATKGLVLDAGRKDVVYTFDYGNLGGTTSFTLARLYIPLIFERNRVIVIDPDTLVFSNLNRLLRDHINEGFYARKAYGRQDWASSVMGIIRGPKFEANKLQYERAARSMEIQWEDKIYLRSAFTQKAKVDVHKISKTWNSFDRIHPTTRLLHFTNLMTQPWLRKGHPCEEVWFEKAHEAFQAGLLGMEHIQIQSKEFAFYSEQTPVLRSDFYERLLKKQSNRFFFDRCSRHFRQLVEDLKFHSPKKFLFTALHR